WPGDPPVEIAPLSRIADGAAFNVSLVRLGTHTGTHIDPPVHFLTGAATLDGVPLDVLFGTTFVADARGLRGALGPDELASFAVPEGTERLLMRSDNSDLWRQDHPTFPDDYVCLGAEGARWVVEKGIRLVGVDFLSIEGRGAQGHPVHVELLSNGVVIVEGLDLGAVERGTCTLSVFPLKITGGDGGPARAVRLVED